jgi:hypothetical protein
LLTGPNVILALKVAVLTVTLLFLTSLVALARGRYRLHGRINISFFVLTALAVVGLELIIRLIDESIFNYLDESARRNLTIHLCFSIPVTAVMPLMLFTGLTHRRRWHLSLAVLFAILWTGTFVTGIFFLPHVP